MATGVVKTVSDRGFGFIKNDIESEKDVFYHENNLEGELASRKLRVGDKVSFDVEQTPKGLNAINIKLLSDGEGASEEAGASDEEAE